MAEFNLSEKREKCYTGDIIHGSEEWYWHYSEMWVKEFIKEFKRRLSSLGEINEAGEIDSHMIYIGDIVEEIDKLAGEELR